MRAKLHKSHSKYLPEFKNLEARGLIENKIIKITDPDDETGRTYNIYEDLDVESPGDERRVLVTIYPHYAKLLFDAMPLDASMCEISHAAAIKDIKKIIDQGYRIELIKRDNYL